MAATEPSGSSRPTLIGALVAGVALAALAVLAIARGDRDHAKAAHLQDAALGSASSVESSPRPDAANFQHVLEERKQMGTRVTFATYVIAEREPQARAAFQAAFDEIARLEKLMSSWRDDSDVAAVNQRAPETVRVSPETFEVLRKSRWAGDISKGKFDITFQTLSPLWKFGDAAEHPPRVPSAKEIDRLRKLVDYRRVKLDPATREVSIPAGVQIGLGGIAKGYIVDGAVETLKRHGLTSFLAQAGGDLYAAGRKPDGSPWTAGIQDPRGKRGSYFATLELMDRAFSTAGDYERAYLVDGKRYHHIIDPDTGYPSNESRSVTVLAPDALLADVIDDVVFMLGFEEGLEVVKALPHVGVVIVDADNQIHISDRLRGRVKLLREPTDGP